MPSHFDRFRLLNDRRFRNESNKTAYLHGDADPVAVLPGAEVELPEPVGEDGILIEIESDTP